MAFSYIFGGDTGETPDSIKAKRQQAERLMFGGGQAPRNIGEGLNSIGDSILGVALLRAAERDREAGQKSASDALGSSFVQSLFGGGSSGAAGAASAGGGQPFTGVLGAGVADKYDPNGEDRAKSLSEYVENGSVEGVKGALNDRALAFLNDNPHGVGIRSGFRDNDKQAQLFQAAVAKYGSEAAARKWVAPPGASQHNHGNALDLSYENDEARKWAHANAGAYGLRFPMGHEPWHVETVDARGGPAFRPPPQIAGAGGGSAPGGVNITYDGALDKSATGRPSPQGMFAHLKGLGASDNEALMLTGAAASESGLNPTIAHDGGTGYGLFGHRLDRLGAMRAFAGTDAPDWQQQGAFALKELRSRPEAALVANAKSPQDLAIAQMHFERPQGYSADNPTAGHNFSGRLGTLNRFASMVGGNQAPVQVASADAGFVPTPPPRPGNLDQPSAGQYLAARQKAKDDAAEADDAPDAKPAPAAPVLGANGLPSPFVPQPRQMSGQSIPAAPQPANGLPADAAQQMLKVMNNPFVPAATKQMLLQAYQQKTAPVNYTTQTIGDTVYRTNPRTGAMEAIMAVPKDPLDVQSKQLANAKAAKDFSSDTLQSGYDKDGNEIKGYMRNGQFIQVGGAKPDKETASLVDVPQADGSTQKMWVKKGEATGVAVGAPTGGAERIDQGELAKERAKAQAKQEAAQTDKAKAAESYMPHVERAYAAYKTLADLKAIGPASASGPSRFVGNLFGAKPEIARQEYEAAAKELELAKAQISMKGQGAITDSERKILALTLPRLDAADPAIGLRTLEMWRGNFNKQMQAADARRAPDGEGHSSVAERQKQITQTPDIGFISNGFRFKGGNPSDKRNWEKL